MKMLLASCLVVAFFMGNATAAPTTNKNNKILTESLPDTPINELDDLSSFFESIRKTSDGKSLSVLGKDKNFIYLVLYDPKNEVTPKSHIRRKRSFNTVLDILGPSNVRKLAVPFSLFNYLGYLPMRVPGIPYHIDPGSPDDRILFGVVQLSTTEEEALQPKGSQGRSWPIQWTEQYPQEQYQTDDHETMTLQRLLRDSLKESPIGSQSKLISEIVKLIQYASKRNQEGLDFSFNELISRSQNRNSEIVSEDHSRRQKRHLRNIFVTPLMIANYLGYTPFPFPGLPKHKDPGAPSHTPYIPYNTHF